MGEKWVIVLDGDLQDPPSIPPFQIYLNGDIMVNSQIKDDKPWDIRDNESSKKYLLFSIYRDLGPTRKLRKAMDIYNKNSKEDNLSLSYFQKLSSQNDWVNRAYAYDIHLQSIIIDNNEETIKEMKSRHSTLAKRFQSLIMEALDYGSIKYKDMNSNQLGYYVDSLSRALERCARLERVSYETEDTQGTIYEEFKYSIDDIQKVISDPKTNRKLSVYLDVLDKLEKNGEDNKEQDKEKIDTVLLTN